MNWTPTVDPLIQTSWQRRNASPVEERTRKNSRDVNTSVEPSTSTLAPVDETSLRMQARRHVPSTAIKFTECSCWNWTRSAFRAPQDICVSEIDKSENLRSTLRSTG